MTIVIDSSITLCWFFDDEGSAAADAVLHAVSELGAIAPSLWRLEVANALQTAVQLRHINEAFRDASLRDLRALPIEIDTDTDQHAWSDTLQLAQRFGLTPYGACYLELAQRLGGWLATLDQDLRSAAQSLGVPLLGTDADVVDG